MTRDAKTPNKVLAKQKRQHVTDQTEKSSGLKAGCNTGSTHRSVDLEHHTEDR